MFNAHECWCRCPLFRIWRESLAIPAYATAVSVVVLFLHWVVVSGPVQRLVTRLFSSNQDEQEDGPSDVLLVEKSHVEKLGGTVIFGYLIARLLSCLALLGLSIATLLLQHDQNILKYGVGDWLQLGLCGVYVSLTSL